MTMGTAIPYAAVRAPVCKRRRVDAPASTNAVEVAVQEMVHRFSSALKEAGLLSAVAEMVQRFSTVKPDEQQAEAGLLSAVAEMVQRFSTTHPTRQAVKFPDASTREDGIDVEAKYGMSPFFGVVRHTCCSH